MTAGLLAACFGPALAAITVLIIGWRALRTPYVPDGARTRDDERVPAPQPAVLKPRVVVYRNADADTARVLAATELPRFPFPKGGRP